VEQPSEEIGEEVAVETLSIVKRRNVLFTDT